MDQTAENASDDVRNSPPSGSPSRVDAKHQTPKFQLHTIDQVLGLPVPEWLIEGILGLDTLAVMYGQPGEGKSFIALDMALAVTVGHSWHGHSVTKKSTVYVVAEGGR